MSERAVYTHGHTESVLRSHTWRTAANSAAYLLPYLQPDMSILDVGCGPGTITVDLASYVPKGAVTGLDSSADVIAKASQHAEQHGVQNILYTVGDANTLPFPDATFDVTHAHQVLQHVSNPVHILREMHRVTKPGGLVAVRETDFAGMFWYPESPGLTDWGTIYARVARANGGEPNAGRRLLAWAHEAGFDPATVKCTASAWCYATPDERAWWGGLWAERLTKSNFAPTAMQHKIATIEEIEQLCAAWRAWAEAEDAWFSVPHGEILCVA
jgi:ubiquinone/menaquinone biosynthesis C-methylase UbiE